MLTQLQFENFRNFKAFDLRIESPSVLLCGSNGQGKTSVLEALFFLANLRSFRTVRIAEMIQFGQTEFRICGSVDTGTYTNHYEVCQNTVRRLKRNQQPVSRASDFTGAYKTIAFLPDDSAIVTGASQLRRRFFDMFISMMSRDYFSALQRYSAALKSRNAILRAGLSDPGVLAAYDAVLSEHGAFIVEKRIVYVRMLSDFMRNILRKIRPELSNFDIRMRYGRGMENRENFLMRLSMSVVRDKLAKFTSCGPHLDDFDFISDDRNLRNYGSRGQCRMISLALKLAELDIVNSGAGAGRETVVLIDDATGDLDRKAKDAFFARIKEAGQVFYAFTGLEEQELAAQSQIVTISGGKMIY